MGKKSRQLPNVVDLGKVNTIEDQERFQVFLRTLLCVKGDRISRAVLARFQSDNSDFQVAFRFIDPPTDNSNTCSLTGIQHHPFTIRWPLDRTGNSFPPLEILGGSNDDVLCHPDIL